LKIETYVTGYQDSIIWISIQTWDEIRCSGRFTSGTSWWYGLWYNL